MNYPLRAELVAAFRRLQFDFDRSVVDDAAPARGYAADGILEIAPDIGAVSLLVSVDTRPQPVVRSAVALATVSSVLGIGFLDWLSTQIRTRGFAHPWTAQRTFGTSTVLAEYFSADAMLVTVYGEHQSFDEEPLFGQHWV